MRNSVLLLLSFIVVSFCSCNQSDRTPPKNESDTTKNTISVDSLVIELAGSDSVSVLDLLLESHEVEYKTSLMGVFVKSIDSIENRDNCFWVYSVNGEKGTTAADKFLTSDGDVIKWHFRRF